VQSVFHKKKKEQPVRPKIELFYISCYGDSSVLLRDRLQLPISSLAIEGPFSLLPDDNPSFPLALMQAASDDQGGGVHQVQ
jgi:hypothetical protein